MTKAEAREVANLAQYRAHIDAETIALSLSALIRAASRKSRAELLEIAHQWGVANHPEFII